MAAAVVVAVGASESTPPRGAGICMSSLDAPSHLFLMALTDEGRSAHLLWCGIQVHVQVHVMYLHVVSVLYVCMLRTV